jgi:hypothetical protein
MYRIGTARQLNADGGCFGNNARSVGINVLAEGGIYFNSFVGFFTGKENGNG